MKYISLRRAALMWSKMKTYVGNQISGFYTKPSTGIPKTDLSEEVKDSLNKADTALQSFTENDPTVPAWAKQSSKPTYTAQEVGALPATTIDDVPTSGSNNLVKSGGIHNAVSEVTKEVGQEIVRTINVTTNTLNERINLSLNSGSKLYIKAATTGNYGFYVRLYYSDGTPYTSLVNNETREQHATTWEQEVTLTAPLEYIQFIRYNVTPGFTININVKYGLTGNVINLQNQLSNLKYAGSQSVGGAANKAVSIPFGQVDSTSTNIAYTATVDGITELRDGVWCMLKLNINSIINATLNINNLGAKSIKTSLNAQVVGNTLIGDCYYMFVYDNSIDTWIMYAGYNTDDIASLIRFYNSYKYLYSAVNGVTLLVTRNDGKLLPLHSSTTTTEATKVMTTESFDPFGDIYVKTSNTAYSANARIQIYWIQYYINPYQLFNISFDIATYSEFYMVCVPQSDGQVKLATVPFSQQLPSTEDGLVYIFLGVTTSKNNLSIFMHKPCYYFKNGAIRQWTNASTDQYQEEQFVFTLADNTTVTKTILVK